MSGKQNDQSKGETTSMTKKETEGLITAVGGLGIAATGASVLTALFAGSVLLSGCAPQAQTQPQQQTQQVQQQNPNGAMSGATNQQGQNTVPAKPTSPNTQVPPPMPPHNPGTPVPQRAASSEIGTIDFDFLMTQHPKFIEGQNLVNAQFDELQKEMEAARDPNKPDAPPNIDIEKFQEKQGNIVREAEEKYAKPAKAEVDAVVEQVMQEKGMKALIAKHAMIRGGEDITGECANRLGIQQPPAPAQP